MPCSKKKRHALLDRLLKTADESDVCCFCKLTTLADAVASVIDHVATAPEHAEMIDALREFLREERDIFDQLLRADLSQPDVVRSILYDARSPDVH